MGQFYSLENWKTNFTFPTSARPLKEKVFVQQSVSLGRRQDHPGGHSSLWHGLIHFVCVCVCVPHKYTVHTQREPAMSRPSTVLSSSSYQEEGLGYANMFLPQGLWIRGCEQCKEVLFTCQPPASQTHNWSGSCCLWEDLSALSRSGLSPPIPSRRPLFFPFHCT